ncbi:MAG: C1 family peptidase [Bacteroidota bacterium]|nr:C1 family peptidase [Bacteroidota bacterium]
MGWNWLAGHTRFVKQYYSEKKSRFGEKHNLKGIDYYKGGVYEYYYAGGGEDNGSGIIKNFDWRTRHSANSETTPYFTYKYPNSNHKNPYWDGNPDNGENGNGWITGIGDQGNCGSCWAFSTTASVEAVTNLYFNQHIDQTDNLRISERHVLNCSGFSNNCDGGFAYSALYYFVLYGRVNEECYPYRPPFWDDFNGQCANNDSICEDPDRIIKIENRGYFIDTTVLEIKQKLIKYGPYPLALPVGYFSQEAPHSVLLVGYNYNEEEQRTEWVFKNSWG